MEVGEEEDSIYLSLHCHHQNDSCVKTSSDENHFNVSLTVRDKVTRQCPQNPTFLKRKNSLSPHLHTLFPPFSPSLICLMVSVDVKQHLLIYEAASNRGPSAYQPNGLPLGQTDSHFVPTYRGCYIPGEGENWEIYKIN